MLATPFQWYRLFGSKTRHQGLYIIPAIAVVPRAKVIIASRAIEHTTAARFHDEADAAMLRASVNYHRLTSIHITFQIFRDIILPLIFKNIMCRCGRHARSMIGYIISASYARRRFEWSH